MRTNVSQRIVQLSNTIGEQACCHCILELLLSGDTETENYECFNITCRMYGCGVYVLMQNAVVGFQLKSFFTPWYRQMSPLTGAGDT